jgi:hypothetical protein
METTNKPTHPYITLLGVRTWFIVRIPYAWHVRTLVVWNLKLASACGTAVYKIPLQYHFFEEPDFSGKGAWYYIWQQSVYSSTTSPKFSSPDLLQNRNERRNHRCLSPNPKASRRRLLRCSQRTHSQRKIWLTRVYQRAVRTARLQWLSQTI